MSVDIAEIPNLSVKKRLELIEEIWDSIAVNRGQPNNCGAGDTPELPLWPHRHRPRRQLRSAAPLGTRRGSVLGRLLQRLQGPEPVGAQVPPERLLKETPPIRFLGIEIPRRSVQINLEQIDFQRPR